MKPQAIIGTILIIAGAVILLLRGVSYTKDRQTMQVGPIGVTAEQKGFIPPIAGIIVLAAGVVLVFTARRKS